MVVPPSIGGGASSSASTTVRTATVNGTSTTNASRSRLGGGNGNGAQTSGHTIPLSARKSQPLDLSSVERRGQATAAREVPKLDRPHGLQEAPTFRPTEEEFRHPMEYMRKIASEGRKYGIVKIIPPDGWNPNFAIDTERFHFRTRRQELNSVEGGTRANLNYLDQLAKFHRQHGNNLNRFPSVDKRPLDLYKLKKTVEDKGGFDRVCKHKKWAEVGRDLGYSGKIMSSLSTSLKNSYQRWLHPYEEYLRIAKPGVHQMLELENGGPFTPSPGPSPIKRPHQYTPTNLGIESPAVRASAALNATLQGGTAPQSEPPHPVMQSGFTAVNAGGFTAVNAQPSASGFSAINAANGLQPASGNAQSPPQRLTESSMTAIKPETEPRPPALNQIGLSNGQFFNALKRPLPTHSDGSINGDSDGTGRRSKRLKNDSAPTVAGSHMTQPRLPPPRLHPPRDRSNDKPGDRCETCGKDDDPTAILLCDSCENGYHRYCLEPPLKSTPDYDWHCPRCLVGTGEFGFEEGGVYSLRQFQEKAHHFKENYFLPKMPFDPVLNCKRPVTEDDVEREFWRLVESITETVEVEYGADVHSTTHGSGFPTIEKNPRDPYSVDPWNLNILPLDKESLFRHIKSDISGMTVPWLYVGMCFSTFCWHSEDHYTYSANYQHFGATKTWYGIPAEDAAKFEEAMRDAVPELFETQPDLLFQLVTLLPPEKLKKAGVRVYALDQRAGQFVITFPQAYHAGFNHGFNFNEAVNFAPPDWEPFGEAGVQRLQDFRRQPCFSHDELLVTAAGRDHSIKTARWLGPALQRMMDREFKARGDFFSRHEEIIAAEPYSDMHIEMDPEIDEGDLTEEEYICSYCKAYSFLSRFVCRKSGKVVCLLHAGTFECCDSAEEHRFAGAGGEHTLHYRLTNDELRSTVQKIVDTARTPEVWTEKLEKLMEEGPKPSLKVLRSLLTEGERINTHWALPELPELKRFVERCNEWVEEATNYITRKQQNRRKNERAWRKGNPAKAAELEERDRELRKFDNIKRLLTRAEEISFDCPEITVLQERADATADFQRQAQKALSNPSLRTTQELDELVEQGKGFSVDIPEVEQLDKLVQQMRWYEQARECRDKVPTLQEVDDLIQQGISLAILETDPYIMQLKERKQQGELWEAKVKELIAMETIHYPQLDALAKQAAQFPVSKETLDAVDAILKKQRDAEQQIMSLYERSKEQDFRKRPHYKEVREAMDALNELNSKPNGTLDLEKEQKRHEDWMRRGKKLFGKANAPLHILLSHMQYVENKNEACLDLSDQPRMPVEPSSRANTPVDSQDVDGSGSSRDVFCICRRPEAGMMIECELCHEWYHGKCLKIARGKVKEDDKYTCPICDWRVKIPRDAARPKLEELQAWQEEIPTLPFQPEEEECLSNIINHASEFRAFMQSFINPMLSNPDELTTQRFYLRKIEGADILLADETNFFRQELHKWAPVAPVPPPIIEVSVSTRKPRPTKQQKMMAQLGIDNPEDLPPEFRTKPHTFKNRKTGDAAPKTPQTLQPAPDAQSHTPPGLPHGMSLHTSANLDSSLTSRAEQHPAFSYDPLAMTTSFDNDPLFASSDAFGHSGYNSASPAGANFDAHMDASLDPAMFDGSGNQARSPTGNHFGGSSSHSGHFDNIFADLTNQDDATAMASMAGEALSLTAPAGMEGDDGEGAGDSELMNDFLEQGPGSPWQDGDKRDGSRGQGGDDDDGNV